MLLDIMKVVRLPSGPLACVYSMEAAQGSEESAFDSGVFRAHSGSLHADGESEDEALAVLDAQVRRISIPPANESDADSQLAALPPTESRWAMRVRKCGSSSLPRSDASASDVDKSPGGSTLPPPFSTAPPTTASGS